MDKEWGRHGYFIPAKEISKGKGKSEAPLSGRANRTGIQDQEGDGTLPSAGAIAAWPRASSGRHLTG